VKLLVGIFPDAVQDLTDQAYSALDRFLGATVEEGKQLFFPLYLGLREIRR
jgi:hypothetical protein